MVTARPLPRRLALLAAAGVMACAWATSSRAWFWSKPTWPDTKQRVRESFPGVPLRTVAQLKAWQDDPARVKPVLIDVRTAIEYQDSQLRGALHAVDADSAQRLLAARPRDVPIVVYCSVGYRSGAIAAQLIERGYTRVHNLEGSIFEWANSGLTVYQGDSVATRVHPYDSTWGQLLRRDLWSREP